MNAQELAKLIREEAERAVDRVAVRLEKHIETLQKAIEERSTETARIAGRVDEIKAVSLDDVRREIDLDAIADAAAKLVPAPEIDLTEHDARVADLTKELAAVQEQFAAYQQDVGEKLANMERNHVDQDKLVEMVTQRALDVVHEGLEKADKRSDALVTRIEERREDIDKQLAHINGRLDQAKAVTASDVMAQIDTHEIAEQAAEHISIPTVDDVASIVTASYERRYNDHMLSRDREMREQVQRAIDRMPVPRDGKDAVPLDALNIEQRDDGRTVTLSFAAGEMKKSYDLHIPALIYRGIHREDVQYSQGDVVTRGGSMWVAKTITPSGKPGDSEDWQLAVKHGRDVR